MSDQDTDQQAELPTEGANMPINILAQYVRDISFENPGAPETLRAGRESPEMNINIGMDARKIPDDEIENLYETVVNFQAVATRAGDPVFILEMQYGITCVLTDIPEDSHHPVLLIEIPRLAFPYIRQIVSETTISGGFPPLILNPVDFQALYLERYKDQIEATKNQVREAAEETVKTASKKEKKTPAKKKK